MGFSFCFQARNAWTPQMQRTRLKKLRTQKMKSNTFCTPRPLMTWLAQIQPLERQTSILQSFPPTTQAIQLHMTSSCSIDKNPHDLQVFLQQGFFIWGSLIAVVITHCGGVGGQKTETDQITGRHSRAWWYSKIKTQTGSDQKQKKTRLGDYLPIFIQNEITLSLIDMLWSRKWNTIGTSAPRCVDYSSWCRCFINSLAAKNYPDIWSPEVRCFHCYKCAFRCNLAITACWRKIALDCL